MLKRRRRRRSRMRMSTRYRRRRFRTRRKGRAEVKYWTYASVNEKSVPMLTQQTITADIPTNFQALSDIYNNIVNGTSSRQRVGNKIFVKSILIKGYVYLCLDASITSVINCGIFRVSLLGQFRDTNNIIRAYRTPYTRNYVDGLYDRSTVRVWADKTYYFNPHSFLSVAALEDTQLDGLNGTSPVTLSGSSNLGCANGSIRPFKINVPVNRTVEFTEQGGMRDKFNNLQLVMIGHLPGWGELNTPRRAFCTQFNVTVYYTDI